MDTVFQALTEVFALRHRRSGAAPATVFQASLGLVIDPVRQVIRGSAAPAASAPTPVAALSAAPRFADLHEALVGRHRRLDPDPLRRCLPLAAAAEQVQAQLRARRGQAWTASWGKAVNQKRRPPKPQAKQSGAPTSVHQVLQAAKADKDQKQKASTSSG